MQTQSPGQVPAAGGRRLGPRRVLTGAGVVLLAVVAVVLAVFLLRDPGQPVTRDQSVPTDAELARLRQDAAAAAATLFERIERADATGDPSVLDGVYVPGSQLESGQKDSVQRRRARGELLETRGDVRDVQVLSVSRAASTLRLDYVVSELIRRDAATRKVIARQAGGTLQFKPELSRVADRWLVSDLNLEKRT